MNGWSQPDGVRIVSRLSNDCSELLQRRDVLQLRVLGFRLLQDGDFRIGVFPQTEEVLICRRRFNAIASHRLSATDERAPLIGRSPPHRVSK